MEDLVRDKRYFLEQFVLNQAYVTPEMNTFNAVSQAVQAWDEIQKVLNTED